MKLPFRIDRPVSRLAIFGAVLILSPCLVVLVLADYIVGALSTESVNVSTDAAPAAFILAPFSSNPDGINSAVLAAAVRYLPGSARLHMRLSLFEILQGAESWTDAEYHARRAIALSPHDYQPHLLLATIMENRGQTEAAQQSVRAALQLAPGNLQAHLQLSGILLESGKLAESLPEFRIAASGDSGYFQLARDLVWDWSGNDADAVIAITPDNAKAKVATAQFLLQKSRPAESAAIFRDARRSELLADRESAGYLNTLIAGGHVTLAHDLWNWLMEADSEGGEERGLIRNGGFESDILLDWPQFDWSLSANKFAQISIDPNSACSGRRSLRIDFLGHETTRLDNEITQLMVVRPGARYRVSYQVKTEGLSTSEGPRVVVSPHGSGEWISASEPAPTGSNNWRRLAFDFTAPGPSVVIAIKQKPKFSYEDPTHGAVWYDDFEMAEEAAQRDSAQPQAH